MAKLMTRGVAVAAFKVPEFTPPPDVLKWGDRIFKRVRGGEYRECFAHELADSEQIELEEAEA